MAVGVGKVGKVGKVGGECRWGLEGLTWTCSCRPPLGLLGWELPCGAWQTQLEVQGAASLY